MSLPCAEAPDPLATQTAKELADVMNDFKAQIVARNSFSRMDVVGNISLTLDSQCYMFTIPTTDLAHEIRVKVHPVSVGPLNSPDLPPATSASASGLTVDPRVILADVTASKRPIDDDSSPPSKKRRFNTDPKTGACETETEKRMKHDNVSITRLATTSPTSSKNKHAYETYGLPEQTKDKPLLQAHEQFSVLHEGTLSTGFWMNLADDVQMPNTPTPSSTPHSLTPQHLKTLSQQIKWVDECRRVDARLHDDRENVWRRSNAAFHTRQQQDRQAFQDTMMQRTDAQDQMLRTILEQVNAMAAFADEVSKAREKRLASTSKSEKKG